MHRCARGDLGRCLAPCAGRCTRNEYAVQVDLGRRFVERDIDVPLALLRERMAAAAERLHFEYAAVLRDRAVLLETARDELVALHRTIESLSFAYEVRGLDGDDRIYVIRRGSIQAELPVRSADERSEAQRVARTTLARPDHTLASVTPDDAAEALLLARWFRLHPEELGKTTRPP